MQLTIQNVSKTYGNGVKALQNINLTLGKGMFGLLGPNGAGKSSLMRSIATLQEPDQGTITFNGFDVLMQQTAVRQVLGYLPQEFGVYPTTTAEQLLDYIALLKGIEDRKARRQRVEQLLVLTNLWDHRKKKLGGYSGGMKQRFGIAQALIGDPKLVIVDEPTAGLDPGERDRFHTLLSGISEDVTVILSTHIVSDVADLCNDMAIISQGQVLLHCAPQAAIEQMKGKVWSRIVHRSEAESIMSGLRVLTSRLTNGQVLIRAFGSASPGEGFAPTVPDLEDVYFSYVKSYQV